MRKTGLYGRVSTANQEQEETIKAQILAIKELIGKRGLNLVKEYTDDGWSGDILARPGLDALREDARKHLLDVVVFYDPDRIARRYSYQELILDELKELGIEVIFVTVSTPKNSEEKILHGVRGLFAEYERAKIAERFRLGKVRRVKEGHILLTEAPYGYRYILRTETDKGHLEIEESEARVLRLVFEWIDREDLSIRGVIRRLSELNIKPRKSKRGVWSTSTLSTILRNRTYIGEASWGVTYAVNPENPYKIEKYRRNRKSSRRTRPEFEWYKIAVIPIIDAHLFERVQARLTNRTLNTPRVTKNEYLLTGLIKCKCGKGRGGEGPQRGKHLYYRCNGRVLDFPLPTPCSEKSINARVADRIVWAELKNLMTTPELLQMQIHKWIKSNQLQTTSAKIDFAFLEKEMGKLKEQEDRYNRAYGAGLLSIEQLKNYSESIRDKMASYEGQMQIARDRNKAMEIIEMPDQTQIAQFAKLVTEDMDKLDFKSKKAIVRKTVEKVVATREKLELYGIIKLEKLTMSKSALSIGMERTDLEFQKPGISLSIPFHIEVKMPAPWPVGPAK